MYPDRCALYTCLEMNDRPTVKHWTGDEPPTREGLEAMFLAEGLRPSWWSNGPRDTYAPHSHSYHKVLYCARGSIQFTVHPSGDTLELRAGDRLDMPPATSHSAVVGPEGVSCVEAPRS